MSGILIGASGSYIGEGQVGAAIATTTGDIDGINSVTLTSIKTINNIAKASIKTWNGSNL